MRESVNALSNFPFFHFLFPSLFPSPLFNFYEKNLSNPHLAARPAEEKRWFEVLLLGNSVLFIKLSVQFAMSKWKQR